MKKKTGFTLLELIITVALISMVMAFGIPAMTTFTQNDRLITNINALIGNLAYARSEAVKRSQQVSLCVSDNETSCNGADWAAGWIIYVDADASTTFTVGDEIIRVQQELGNNNTLAASGSSGTQITYDNRGYVTNAAGSSFKLCDARTGAHGKTLRISTTGRVRLEKDPSTCP